MDNQTKQCLATLEYKVLRLERIVESFTLAITTAQNSPAICAQCGMADPHDNSYICPRDGCCQGLNPDDDHKQ